MGVRARATQKSEEAKAARLDKVCTLMEEKADAPVVERSRRKTWLTEEALEARREHWATFRQDMLVCCENEEEDEELVQCFKDAHGRRLAEKMCGAEDEDFKQGEIPEKIRAAKEKCCENEEEQQRDCLMDTTKVMKQLKKHHRRAKHNNETRVEAICRKVEKHPVPPKAKLSTLPIVQKNRWTSLFTERRLQVSECCKLAEEEQESCLEDLREQRLDRVCQGEEELSPPWKKRKADGNMELTEECCVLEDTERYECFAEKMPRRGHRGRHHGHRGQHKHHHHRRGRKDEADESVEEEEESAERGGRRVNKKMMSRRERVSRQKNRRHGRVCCQGGRNAGNLLEAITRSKWQTCQQEAKGFVIDREEAKPNADLCTRSFRKCCVQTVIRKVREMALEKAEEEDLVDEEISVED